MERQAKMMEEMMKNGGMKKKGNLLGKAKEVKNYLRLEKSV